MDCRGRRWMLLQMLLGMASIWQHPQSQYFTACFRDHNGRQRAYHHKRDRPQEGAKARR
jgi:hypothetical protein